MAQGQIGTAVDSFGMQTGYCIDTTCRRAASLGYTVELVRDARTTFASDKRRAFREILEMTDPKAFLAKSGWYPGIQLQ